MRFWNLIGPFGGWVAGSLTAAVLREAQGVTDPISLSVAFMGPLTEGPFVVRPRLLRANRSTHFWSAEVAQHQDGVEASCVFGQLVLAKRRDTIEMTESPFPVVPAAEEIAAVDPGTLGVPWFERYEMRFIDPPGRGRLGHGSAWVRSRDGGALDFPTLAALCDLTFPQLVARVHERFPISTVSLNAYFHVDADELAAVGDDFVLLTPTMRIARSGFFDESASLWSRAGRLLATTEQIVWFKYPANAPGAATS